MIHIISKEQCCGCSACLHICPKHSISFKEDNEGFLYPEVDVNTCIDCGICEKVCQVINQNEERLPLKVLAAKHPDDEIRMSSSSGGIFTLLADQIIDEGGVVFGAKFDKKWEVVHSFAETKEDLVPFRGSKYVQSRIGDAYVKAEEFLKSGRKVMFTGTPCQIAGLKRYLRNEYENLLAVDLVCHGVPSPMVWKKYFEEETTRQGTIAGNANLLSSQDVLIPAVVNFRDKSTGWQTYSVTLKYSSTSDEQEEIAVCSSAFYNNIYMQAFLSNLSLRPSCYSCVAKAGRSGADITIGDFWGIENVLSKEDDDKGVSLVLIWEKDKIYDFNANLQEVVYADAIRGNACICDSVAIPVNRLYFFKNLECKGFVKSLKESQSRSLFFRVKRALFRKIGTYK